MRLFSAFRAGERAVRCAPGLESSKVSESRVDTVRTWTGWGVPSVDGEDYENR